MGGKNSTMDATVDPIIERPLVANFASTMSAMSLANFPLGSSGLPPLCPNGPGEANAFGIS